MARVRTKPIRNHIRTNVVGYVAVFLALSGTATALTGSNTVFSDDITNDEVRSADVRNETLPGGGLVARDLRDDSVDSSEIVDGAVDTAEVEDNGLGGADIRDGSINGVDVNDQSLTGDDIQESSLGQVPSALLGGFGRTGAESSCDPESGTFETCAATPILNVPAGARALLFARVQAKSEPGVDRGFGECRLGTSSVGVVANTTVSIRISDSFSENATLVGVTPPLPAGSTAFGIDCNQELPNGAIEYDDVSASVLLIAAN